MSSALFSGHRGNFREKPTKGLGLVDNHQPACFLYRFEDRFSDRGGGSDCPRRYSITSMEMPSFDNISAACRDGFPP